MVYYTKPPADPELDLLPTYEAATARDPLLLVARYLRREDLFSASLVSQSWRAALISTLWSAPHRCWGMGERSELTSFLLFLRTLKYLAHPMHHTRSLSLVHVRASIYTSLPAHWLSTLLQKLPQLRSLHISDFPSFDHASLLAITHPHHTLTHLSAHHARNATPNALASLIAHLPALRSLDLAHFPAAAHPTVLAAIAALLHLHTVSLRATGLSNATLATLARALSTRLRAFDASYNTLSDAAVQTLVGWNIAPPRYEGGEDAAGEAGLTHVWVCETGVTAAGIATLVKTGRVATLDGGKVESAYLVPLLAMYAFATLRMLRIGSGVVMRAGLKRGALRALERLVLVGVPEWADEVEVTRLVTFVVQGGDKLRVLELEMTGADEGGVLEGEFSFFGGDGEGEGEAAEEHGGGRVETLKAVKAARDSGTGWRGRVRVLRDLAGREAAEMGVEGQRWGVVGEGL